MQALHGNLAAPYDPPSFINCKQPYFYLSWPYPPPLFFVLLPFGLLPYVDSVLCWDAATLAGCLAVVYLIARRPAAIAVVLASPFSAWNLKVGQNGFLTASLLGAALISSNAVRTSRASLSDG